MYVTKIAEEIAYSNNIGYAYIYDYDAKLRDVCLIRDGNIAGMGHAIQFVHRLPIQVIEFTEKSVKDIETARSKLGLQTYKFKVQRDFEGEYLESIELYDIDRCILLNLGFRHLKHQQFNLRPDLSGILNAYYDHPDYSNPDIANNEHVNDNGESVFILNSTPTVTAFGLPYSGIKPIYKYTTSDINWVELDLNNFILGETNINNREFSRIGNWYIRNQAKKYGNTIRALYSLVNTPNLPNHIANMVKYEVESNYARELAETQRRVAEAEEAEKRRVAEAEAQKRLEELRRLEDKKRKAILDRNNNIEFVADLYGFKYYSFREIVKKFTLSTRYEYLFEPFNLDAELALTLARSRVDISVSLVNIRDDKVAEYTIKGKLDWIEDKTYTALDIIAKLEPGVADVYRRKRSGEYNPVLINIKDSQIDMGDYLIDGCSTPFIAFNRSWSSWFDACRDLGIKCSRTWKFCNFSYWDSELLMVMKYYGLTPEKDIKAEFLSLKGVMYYTLTDNPDELLNVKDVIKSIDSSNKFRPLLNKLKLEYNPVRRVGDE